MTRQQSVQNGTPTGPLAAVASIQPLSSPAATDIDAAEEDGPSTLPSTKPRTHVAEIRKASISTSASCRAVSSPLSYSATSSRRSASRARPGGSPRSKSQITVVGRSSHERRSSIFWNSVTSSLTTSTWKVLLGERPGTNSTVVDTDARSAASSSAILV
jgi:hypothetical protein